MSRPEISSRWKGRVAGMLGLLSSCACLSPERVAAQAFDFEVNNGLTTAQVSVAKTSALPGPAVSEGSLSAIQQSGYGNSAAHAVRESLRAAGVALQLGNKNISRATILGSPGSSVAQVQIGSDNLSLVNVIGGRNNTVSTGQIGNSLGMVLGLVNSRGTQVVYGQAGESYSGGITIRNAPPGTRIEIE